MGGRRVEHVEEVGGEADVEDAVQLAEAEDVGRLMAEEPAHRFECWIRS